MGGWAGGSQGNSNPANDLDYGKTSVNLYNEVPLVASGAEQIIIQYTVPLLYHLMVNRIEFSGSNIATFRFYIGGTVNSLTHTWFNGGLSDAWDFNSDLGSLRISAGTTIKVTGFHNRPAPCTFAARIGGNLLMG